MRYRLRTLLIAIAGVALLSWYGRSYYLLSRRGMDQARFANSIHGGDEAHWRDNWSYITHDEIQHDLDAGTDGNLNVNCRRYWFYRPAALIDQYVFGSPPPWIPRPQPKK